MHATLSRLAAGRARWAVAVLLVLHGLIHGIGVFGYLGWSGPPEGMSSLTPEPGSPAGVAVALVWLVAGAAFVAAGVLLARRDRRWPAAAVAAAVVSLPAVALVAPAAPLGLAFDVVVLAVAGLWAGTLPRAGAAAPLAPAA